MKSLKLLLNHPETKMFIHNIWVLAILIAIIIVFLYIRKKHHQSISTQNVFITIFLFFLIFPTLQQQFNIFQYKPLDEKRLKLTPPQGNILSSLLKKDNLYAKNYEKYYNDNYGFRDNFIRLKNQLDYSLFKVSDEVLVGKNNFLFYKSVIEKEKIYIEQQAENDFLNTQNKILEINSNFKKQGILFVIMPIPMKDNLYSELYNKRTTQIPTVTRFDKLLNFLNSHPEVKTIPVKNILLENKKNYPLFFRTDFHWNDVGAHFVSQATINLLASWTKTNIIWDYDLNIETRPFSGGQNNYLATLFLRKEQALFVNPDRFHLSQSLETELPLIYHFQNSPSDKQKLLPKTFFLGNSFLLNLLNTGFFDSFSEVLVMHSNNIQKLSQVLPSDTKIIILQLIEVDLLKGFIFE